MVAGEYRIAEHDKMVMTVMIQAVPVLAARAFNLGHSRRCVAA